MSLLQIIKRKLGFKNYYSAREASQILKKKLEKEFKTDSGEIDWKAATIAVYGVEEHSCQDLRGAVDFPNAYWKHALIWEWVGIKRAKMFEDS